MKTDSVGTEEYYRGGTSSAVCYGYCLESQGNPGTDKLFTGQRLDSTGLYFYNARYYDPTIGRFISPDTIVQSQMNPQNLNRYSYCLNNPLKYIDPTGYKGLPLFEKILLTIDITVTLGLAASVLFTGAVLCTFAAPTGVGIFGAVVCGMAGAATVGLLGFTLKEIWSSENEEPDSAVQLPVTKSEPISTTAPEPALPTPNVGSADIAVDISQGNIEKYLIPLPDSYIPVQKPEIQYDELGCMVY